MESHSPVTIRSMTIEDIDRVVQIDQLSFNLPWTRSSFRYEVAENKASRQWVAEVIDEGQPIVVGMLVCWIILDEAHVGTIAVHPDFRGKKIGEKLLFQAFSDFKHEEIRIVYLEVRRSNEAALALYHRFGFIEDGVRKRYYKDNNEDAILMELTNLDFYKGQE